LSNGSAVPGARLVDTVRLSLASRPRTGHLRPDGTHVCADGPLPGRWLRLGLDAAGGGDALRRHDDLLGVASLLRCGRLVERPGLPLRQANAPVSRLSEDLWG